MARGKLVSLATRSFANQLEATAIFMAMLKRYEPGDRVIDIDALDLTALLERHDEYEQKVKGGIDHFNRYDDGTRYTVFPDRANRRIENRAPFAELLEQDTRACDEGRIFDR